MRDLNGASQPNTYRVADNTGETIRPGFWSEPVFACPTLLSVEFEVGAANTTRQPRPASWRISTTTLTAIQAANHTADGSSQMPSEKTPWLPLESVMSGESKVRSERQLLGPQYALTSNRNPHAAETGTQRGTCATTHTEQRNSIKAFKYDGQVCAGERTAQRLVDKIGQYGAKCNSDQDITTADAEIHTAAAESGTTLGICDTTYEEHHSSYNFSKSKTIGQGTCGSVFVGHYFGETVATSCTPILSANSNVTDHFVLERQCDAIRQLAHGIQKYERFSHPSIVRSYGVTLPRDDPTALIISDFMAGDNPRVATHHHSVSFKQYGITYCESNANAKAERTVNIEQEDDLDGDDGPVEEDDNAFDDDEVYVDNNRHFAADSDDKLLEVKRATTCDKGTKAGSRSLKFGLVEVELYMLKSNQKVILYQWMHDLAGAIAKCFSVDKFSETSQYADNGLEICTITFCGIEQNCPLPLAYSRQQGSAPSAQVNASSSANSKAKGDRLTNAAHATKCPIRMVFASTLRYPYQCPPQSQRADRTPNNLSVLALPLLRLSLSIQIHRTFSTTTPRSAPHHRSGPDTSLSPSSRSRRPPCAEPTGRRPRTHTQLPRLP